MKNQDALILNRRQVIIPHKAIIKYICHAFNCRFLAGKVFVFPMPIYQKK